MKESELLFLGKKFDAKKAKEFFDELYGESPRAVALLGHAYLENLLKELLKRRLVENESLFKEIDNLNFERCMNLCYLTGIIKEKEKKDLEKINWIRNKFAHRISFNRFNKKEISDKLDGLFIVEYLRILNQPESFPYDKPKDKYTSAIASYMFFLEIRLNRCKRIELL